MERNTPQSWVDMVVDHPLIGIDRCNLSGQLNYVVHPTFQPLSHSDRFRKHNLPNIPSSLMLTQSCSSFCQFAKCLACLYLFSSFWVKPKVKVYIIFSPCIVIGNVPLNRLTSHVTPSFPNNSTGTRISTRTFCSESKIFLNLRQLKLETRFFISTKISTRF